MRYTDSHRQLIALAGAVGLLVTPTRGIADVPVLLKPEELPSGAKQKLDALERAQYEKRRGQQLPRPRTVDRPPPPGEREAARRRRQIERGQLKAENGLVR